MAHPLRYEVTNPEEETKKKISVFGAAKVKTPKTSAKTDKQIVEVAGIEQKLLELQSLKAEIADREAQLNAITDEIKGIGKEKFVELYKADGTNPNTFYLRDGEGCVMVLPTDKYISVKDEARAQQLMSEYGDDVVMVDEKYYFNPEVLERNMDAIEKLIMDAKTITDSDKENLLSKEVKYSIAKGLIDRLLPYGAQMENVITDVQPIFMLKNCGVTKMATGGDFAEGLILDVPVIAGYTLCHYAPVYGESDICPVCGEHAIIISEQEVINQLAELANKEGSEENEQRWEARGYANGGTVKKKSGKSVKQNFEIEVVGKGNKGAFRKREYAGMTEAEVIDWWNTRGFTQTKTKIEDKLKPYTFYILKLEAGGSLGKFVKGGGIAKKFKALKEAYNELTSEDKFRVKEGKGYLTDHAKEIADKYKIPHDAFKDHVFYESVYGEKMKKAKAKQK